MNTIIDVAREAKVSKTLVSRVLNNRKGVSQESKDRILKAMKDLNYRYNGLAKSMVLQKTDTIGVVLDSIRFSFYFDFIKGLESQSEEAGYNIIFASGSNDPDIKRRYIDFFTQGRVDGIIIYGSSMTDEIVIKELSKQNYPFVLIENEIAGFDINNVLVDNFGGAYKATEHLINSGFNDIMHFTGDLNTKKKISMDRLNGYVKAMQDYGKLIKDGMIVISDFNEKSGYVNMKRLLDSGTKPEAVFFGADLTAFGAIRSIYEAGLSVPRDIAVIGFDDDIPESRDIVFPPLSTVRQPMEQMGKTGVQVLTDNIKNSGNSKQKILLNTELVIRESSG
jgi:DNA-binding LacI/PurR family transcriptional regulator